MTISRKVGCLLTALLATGYASAADLPLNMPVGVTDISREVYDLHMWILYVCCAIGVVVFGLMFWSIIYHRKSKGAVASDFHESTKLEIVWTLIPFLILVAMAIPSTKTLIVMEDTSDADLTIQITGSQWKWHYKYFDHDIEFYSLLATPREQIENKATKTENYLLEVDKPLVLPTGKKIRFLITSDDVIHAWWVPDFAVKKDANPGFINESWTNINIPGTYRGQCAELCGKDHGFMPIVVVAKDPAEFDKWVAEQEAAGKQAAQEEQASLASTASKDELMQLGEKIYIASCAACHQPNGQGLPGVFPGLKASPVALGDVKKHISVVYDGVPGTAMQAFNKQLSLKEIAAVVTYERNAWGNNTGDTVQASDVATASGQ